MSTDNVFISVVNRQQLDKLIRERHASRFQNTSMSEEQAVSHGKYGKPTRDIDILRPAHVVDNERGMALVLQIAIVLPEAVDCFWVHGIHLKVTTRRAKNLQPTPCWRPLDVKTQDITT